MGDPQKLSLQTIANINSACAAIGENETLDATVSYRIGRLANYSDSIIRAARSAQNKKIQLIASKTAKMSDAQKIEENQKLQEELSSMMDEEEEINIPKFKYSDFIAKTDMQVGGKTYTKGQALVPVKFFSLMGDLIEDDQKLVGEIKKKDSSKLKVNK